jgi:hypothetical protein
MQSHLPQDTVNAQDSVPATPSPPVTGKRSRLLDDALVTWWERALAGVAVALFLVFLFTILHG